MMNSRRDFLQKMAAITIGLPLITNEVTSKKIIPGNYDGPILRVAIMGLGGYGTMVAEAMKSCTKAKLVGVISGTPSKIKNWQSKVNSLQDLENLVWGF